MKFIGTYEALSEWLDDLLCKKQFGGDKRLSSEIAFKLSNLAQSELDTAQLGALSVARSFWDGLAPQEQLHAAAKSLADRITVNQGIAEKHRIYNLDRLVFAASNANTMFDILVAEYLIDLATDLDMNPKLVADIFVEELQRRL